MNLGKENELLEFKKSTSEMEEAMIDVPEIPVEAIREIVVNSFAHADYLGWSKNEIDVYPNRIATYNPGFFLMAIPQKILSKRTFHRNYGTNWLATLCSNARPLRRGGPGLRKPMTYAKSGA